MGLSAGTRVGPYEVLGSLGAGGMGEVYRARDSRLGREVAIKVLPATFSADPERLQRFEQEARAAAALNHPNILAVYDIGTHDGAPYIVSELLQGDALRARLGPGASGGLPIRKAVDYAIQIARGLSAAHEKGIVHRDLKPDNLFVTNDGHVKILDFGLAKLVQVDAALAGLSQLATRPPETVAGMVLGTVGYMAPEQVRGLPADHRSDIFAFGSILYEMLSGLRAFQGDTTADTMTAILKDDPPDLPTADRRIPPGLERIVGKCLEKHPGARFQSAGDLAFALEGASISSDATEPIQARVLPKGRERLAWLLAGIFALALSVVAARSLLFPPAVQVASVVQAAIPLSAPLQVDLQESSIALSPDGKRLVYRPRGSGPLYLRALDQREGVPLPGTEGGLSPFFSPDGQWVGFFAGNFLRKVSLAGGGAVTLAAFPSALNNRGASWGTDDTIVFTPSIYGSLRRVSGNGGPIQAATTLDLAKEERSHRWPELLPGGKAVIFTVKTEDLASFDDAQIVVRSLETGEQHALLQGAFARYVPTGHLVYARMGSLLAVPFDVSLLQVTGAPVTVLDGVVTHPESGAAQFAISSSGTLVYGPGSSHTAERALAWVDRRGIARPLFDRRAQFAAPRLSPDGRRLAVVIAAASDRVWVSEIARGTLTRVTLGGNHQSPVWVDSARVSFSASTPPQGEFWNLYVESADGSGAPQPLAKIDAADGLAAGSWSPDRQTMFYQRMDRKTGWDLWTVSMQGEPRVRTFLQTPFNEFDAMLSPDGRWVAYASDESGRPEVYVRPFPGPGGKSQISTQEGLHPVWAPSGRELFFAQGNTLMVVPVTTGATFDAGAARPLFSGAYDFGPTYVRNYDVAPDGQHFVVIENGPDDAPTQLNLVLNWFDELKRLVPSPR